MTLVDAEQHTDTQHANAHVSQGEQRSASRRPSEDNINIHSSNRADTNNMHSSMRSMETGYSGANGAQNNMLANMRSMDTAFSAGNRTDSNMHSSFKSMDTRFGGGSRADNNGSHASSILSNLIQHQSNQDEPRESYSTDFNSSFTRSHDNNRGMIRSGSGASFQRVNSEVCAEDPSRSLDFDRDFALLQEDQTDVAHTDHDTDFLRALRPVMHGLYLISKHSSHYNTPQRVSELIRAVCNVTTARAREYVFGESGNAALLHDFEGASVRLRCVAFACAGHTCVYVSHACIHV